MLKIAVETHAASKLQASRRGATQSGLVRVILGEWLEQHGENIDWAVEWGGRPERQNTNTENDEQ